MTTKLGTKSLLKSNLEIWMNDKFLREGLYTNVSVGDVDFYNNNLSELAPVNSDPKFKDGTVFQSAFRNWVYESGIPSPGSGIAPPVVASGVTVDGTFYPRYTTVGTYAHLIDYENGRIVFDTPLVGSPAVEASFAYKMVNIESASKLNNENKSLLIQTARKDNPAQTGIQTFPNTFNRTLPAVWIDVQKRRSLPYELGTRAPIKEYLGVFHIWTQNEFELDLLEDILADCQREVIIGIDFNTAPYPLLINGKRNPNWTLYSNFANENSNYFWRRIYLDQSDPEQVSPLFEIERSQITFNVKVYPNF